MSISSLSKQKPNADIGWGIPISGRMLVMLLVKNILEQVLTTN